MDKSAITESIRVMLWNIIYETAWMDHEEIFYWYVSDLADYGIVCDEIIKKNDIALLHFIPDGTRAAEGFEFRTSVRYQEHRFDIYAKDEHCEPEDIIVVPAD